ncbi:MAG: SpoIID/LytB domain-containing protein [Spirochaetales bacterium]|nr:SpoIID/LytB domain-containing protein [Spirochaetales bacterium]
MRRSFRAPAIAALVSGAMLAVLWSCTTPPDGAPAEASASSPEAPVQAKLEPPARPASLTEAEAVAGYYLGDLEAAEAAYRGILDRRPGDRSARLNLVQVLREAGRHLGALKELEVLLAAAAPDSLRNRQSLSIAAAQTALFAGLPQRVLGYLEVFPEATVPGEPASHARAASALASDAVDLLAEALYLKGLALIDLERIPEAARALAASLERRSYQPLAWLRLGTLHQEMGLPEEAEPELLEALSQDRNLTQAFLHLARIYMADGRTEKAYGLLRRAERALPGNPEVPALLAELLAAHPELTARARVERELRREAAEPKKADSLPSDRASIPAVRVGLAENVQELYLKTGGPFRIESAGEGMRAGGEAGMIVMLRLGDSACLQALDRRGELLAEYQGEVRLSYLDPADTTILFDVSYGQSSFWAGSEDRMYRGIIEATPHPGGITVVNELTIEEYLYSVLPSEMPSSWPAAALQAQAVAARSYTLANLGRFAERGFDLMGSVVSAAYRGMGSENPTVRAALDATRGLLLLQPGDQRKPLSAFYSANCGGHTETTEFVWGFPSQFPARADLLLPPRSDPLPPADLASWLAERPVTFSSHPSYSNRSAYRWRLWVPREEIEARLGLGETLGSVLAITAVRRGASGRIPEVRIRGSAGDATVKWDAIRWKLGGLRSNLFVVEPKLGTDGLPEYFVFTGAGWGHGVGMCQSGAAGMASVGFDARAILRHYYGEAKLELAY